MRTVIIWDTQIDPICFYVVEGDHSDLNQVYINSVEDQDKQDKLNELISVELRKLKDFPELQSGDKVIVAGFLP